MVSVRPPLSKCKPLRLSYPFGRDHSDFFFTLGTGDAYSTTAFNEQGKHASFILQAVLVIVIRGFPSKTRSDTAADEKVYTYYGLLWAFRGDTITELL